MEIPFFVELKVIAVLDRCSFNKGRKVGVLSVQWESDAASRIGKRVSFRKLLAVILQHSSEQFWLPTTDSKQGFSDSRKTSRNVHDIGHLSVWPNYWLPWKFGTVTKNNSLTGSTQEVNPLIPFCSSHCIFAPLFTRWIRGLRYEHCFPMFFNIFTLSFSWTLFRCKCFPTIRDGITGAVRHGSFCFRIPSLIFGGLHHLLQSFIYAKFQDVLNSCVHFLKFCDRVSETAYISAGYVKHIHVPARKITGTGQSSFCAFLHE